MLEIDVIPIGGDNYSYLLVDGTRAAVIDPTAAPPVLQALQKRRANLEWALATHHHGDHIGGLALLVRETGCRTAGPGEPGLSVDVTLREGDVLGWPPAPLAVWATPGHTRTHLCYYLDAGPGGAGPLLWSGDTLFRYGCGRVLGGTAGALWASLQRLAELPGATRVYGGHEYTEENLRFALELEPGHEGLFRRLDEVRVARKRGEATVPGRIDEEKALNPFLRVVDAAYRRSLGLASLSAAAAFVELRRRKDAF